MKLNVEVKNEFFQINVPFVLGLFSCFGSNCGKVPYFTHIDKAEQNNLDILSELHLIDYSAILQASVSPFRIASTVSIVMISISCIITSISLGICFHQLYNGMYVDYERHAILFIGGLLFYYIAAVAYVALTVSSLNGGQYLEGLWLCGNTGMLGLVCSVICLLLSKSNRPEYLPLKDRDFVDIDRTNGVHPFSISSCAEQQAEEGTLQQQQEKKRNEGSRDMDTIEEFVSVELRPLRF